jgi:hypothetical protein
VATANPTTSLARTAAILIPAQTHQFRVRFETPHQPNRVFKSLTAQTVSFDYSLTEDRLTIVLEEPAGTPRELGEGFLPELFNLLAPRSSDVLIYLDDMDGNDQPVKTLAFHIGRVHQPSHNLLDHDEPGLSHECKRTYAKSASVAHVLTARFNRCTLINIEKTPAHPPEAA